MWDACGMVVGLSYVISECVVHSKVVKHVEVSGKKLGGKACGSEDAASKGA